MEALNLEKILQACGLREFLRGLDLENFHERSGLSKIFKV